MSPLCPSQCTTRTSSPPTADTLNEGRPRLQITSLTGLSARSERSASASIRTHPRPKRFQRIADDKQGAFLVSIRSTYPASPAEEKIGFLASVFWRSSCLPVVLRDPLALILEPTFFGGTVKPPPPAMNDFLLSRISHAFHAKRIGREAKRDQIQSGPGGYGGLTCHSQLMAVRGSAFLLDKIVPVVPSRVFP